MIIIGFVVTVMIFSSFAIVFSNSGNNLNNSNKQILNLPEKSLTSNVVNKYQIDLSNLPSGNGYYQQLITLNNYDTYGINSNGSNIEFFSSNNTQLYAWIQSINSTSMQIWIKNFNQSSIMYLYVLQSYENLFNSNGYLGEAPELSSTYGEYDNGYIIFGHSGNLKFYYNYTNTNNSYMPIISDLTLNNGLYGNTNYFNTSGQRGAVIYPPLNYTAYYDTSSFGTNNFAIFQDNTTGGYESDGINYSGITILHSWSIQAGGQLGHSSNLYWQFSTNSSFHAHIYYTFFVNNITMPTLAYPLLDKRYPVKFT